jgi:hypothetical protein
MHRQFIAISVECRLAHRIIIAAAVAHNFGINNNSYGSFHPGISVSLRNHPIGMVPSQLFAIVPQC